MIWKILMAVSWMYITFGVFGIFRFNNLYSRLYRCGYFLVNCFDNLFGI